MAIVLQTNKIAPRLTPFNLKLGDSRLEKIAQARTVEEACEMGWIDSTKDWLYSGAKKRCLETIYNLMNSQDISTFDQESLQKFRGTLAPLSAQTVQFEKLGDASIVSAKTWRTELVLTEKFSRFSKQFAAILDHAGETQSAQKFHEKSMDWMCRHVRCIGLLHQNQRWWTDADQDRYRFELQIFLKDCTDDQKKIFVNNLLSNENLEDAILSRHAKRLLESSDLVVQEQAILVLGNRIKEAFAKEELGAEDSRALGFCVSLISELDEATRGRIGNLVFGESAELVPLLGRVFESDTSILTLFLYLSPKHKLPQTIEALMPGGWKKNPVSSLEWFASDLGRLTRLAMILEYMSMEDAQQLVEKIADHSGVDRTISACMTMESREVRPRLKGICSILCSYGNYDQLCAAINTSTELYWKSDSVYRSDLALFNKSLIGVAIKNRLINKDFNSVTDLLKKSGREDQISWISSQVALSSAYFSNIFHVKDLDELQFRVELMKEVYLSRVQGFEISRLIQADLPGQDQQTNSVFHNVSGKPLVDQAFAIGKKLSEVGWIEELLRVNPETMPFNARVNYTAICLGVCNGVYTLSRLQKTQLRKRVTDLMIALLNDGQINSIPDCRQFLLNSFAKSIKLEFQCRLLCNLPKQHLESALDIFIESASGNKKIHGRPFFEQLGPSMVKELLSYIDRLPPDDNAFKQHLARRIMKSLSTDYVLFNKPLVRSLQEVWLSNPIYLEVPEVMEFFMNVTIAEAEGHPLDIAFLNTYPAFALKLGELILQETNNEKGLDVWINKKFIVKNLVFVTRFIGWCDKQSLSSITKIGVDLRAAYECISGRDVGALLSPLLDIYDMKILISSLSGLPNSLLVSALEHIFSTPVMSLFHYELLNHLGNGFDTSLLVWIDSLPESNKELKQQLASIVASQLNKADSQDIVRLTDSLTDVWLNNPIYMEVPEILALFKKLLIDPVNSARLVVSENQAPVLFKIIDYYLEQEGKDTPSIQKFMIQNNGFFVQFLHYCDKHKNPAYKERGVALHKKYLELPELAAHRESLETLGVLDEEGCSAYLFIHQASQSDGTLLFDAVCLSGLSVDGILGEEINYEWPTSGFLTEEIVLKDGVSSKTSKILTTGQFEMMDKLAPFPVFAGVVESRKKIGSWINLLSLLDLDANFDESEGSDYSYLGLFSKALVSSKTNRKLTGLADQQRLFKIFGRFMESTQTESSLTDDHKAGLNHIFELNTDTAQARANAAGVIFSIGALFTKLSSSKFFGVEADSPEAIRRYAAALLKYANELDGSVFPATGDNSYSRMLSKLLIPKSNTSTCTDMLHTQMKYHAGKSAFAETFKRLTPPGWSIG